MDLSWPLERAARLYGDSVAVIDGPRSVTYAELARRVAALGGALAERVEPGGRIGVLAANSLAHVECFLGIPAAGRVIVSLNYRLADEELAFMVRDAGIARDVGSPPSAAYETVDFTASDGVGLEGWYRPSRNGPSVLLISGGGSNRRGTLRHAEMLARHGYGVLVYDPRGSGNSEGTVNSYGWGWEKDAAAALDFLADRGDAVGALGLSTGADIAIDVAARRDDVKAVVADGAAAIGYEDIEEYSDRPLDRAPMWVLFKSLEVIQGRSGPDESLADQIARSRAPHLIVSAGEQEKEWGEIYDRAGGDHSELWYLPKASHTGALREYPDEYERRVVGFFDEHLR